MKYLVLTFGGSDIESTKRKKLLVFTYSKNRTNFEGIRYFELLDIPSHFGSKVMVGQDLGIGYYYCSIYVPIPNSTELRIHTLNIAAVMVYLILDAALGLLYLPTYSTLLPCVGILLRTCPSMH